MAVCHQRLPATLPLGKPQNNASGPNGSTLFEWPPAAFTKRFEALSPIMARLPVADDIYNDRIDYTATYLKPEPDAVLKGTLPFETANEGLTYTLSHLPTINESSRAIWAALHGLRPLSDDYAGDGQISSIPALHPGVNLKSSKQCPFASSNAVSPSTALTLVRELFNWSSLRLPADTSGKFYGVVFRSKRAAGSESTNLYTADKLAHEEAVRSGGLLMYFYGAPDPDTGVNLATCIWSSRDEARKASRLPMHKLAVEHAKKAYAWFELERYAVIKRYGEEGVRIEAWTDASD